MLKLIRKYLCICRSQNITIKRIACRTKLYSYQKDKTSSELDPDKKRSTLKKQESNVSFGTQEISAMHRTETISNEIDLFHISFIMPKS